MIRGIRGATTVTNNQEDEILSHTKSLVEDMIKHNDVQPNDVASVIVSVTSDINAAFPARPIREFEGWQYVPVMCTQEIDVPGSLPKCIRVMMTVNTSIKQEDIHHIYHHDAKKLRPDLLND